MVIQINGPTDAEKVLKTLSPMQKQAYSFLETELRKSKKEITVKDVIDTLTPLQKEAMFYKFGLIMIGQA